MSALADGVYLIRCAATKTVVTANPGQPYPKLVCSKLNFDSIDQQLFSVKVVGKNSTYLITHVSTGRVADLERHDPADLTPIITYPVHWGDNQLWNITPNGGAYQVLSVSSKKPWDLTGGDPKDGTPVINYRANGGQNQLWEFKKVGPYVS